MIARLTGRIEGLDAERAAVLLVAGAVGYEVLVPGYAVSDLSARQGEVVTLYCWQYLEGSAIGGNLVPRLIGFPREEDRAFFHRFVSVKGIGVRKALRALAQPIERIAGYVEDGDDKMLSSLPEIGKRTAQTIIAELQGKLTSYALGGPRPGREPLSEAQRAALEILLQLGERRDEAEELIGRARKVLGAEASADALVQGVYKLKTGAVR